jgi:hypothetical protein
MGGGLGSYTHLIATEYDRSSGSVSQKTAVMCEIWWTATRRRVVLASAALTVPDKFQEHALLGGFPEKLKQISKYGISI